MKTTTTSRTIFYTSTTAVCTYAMRREKCAGTLPPEMSRMTSLALLDLRHNKISGNIPQLFGRLTNLQQLWLQDNQLTGK